MQCSAGWHVCLRGACGTTSGWPLLPLVLCAAWPASARARASQTSRECVTSNGRGGQKAGVGGQAGLFSRHSFLIVGASFASGDVDHEYDRLRTGKQGSARRSASLSLRGMSSGGSLNAELIGGLGAVVRSPLYFSDGNAGLCVSALLTTPIRRCFPAGMLRRDDETGWPSLA